MKNKEYALALSGGGTRGAYEIGAYRALKEIGINIVAIAGTSIGALNGAMFVSDNLDKAEGFRFEYSHPEQFVEIFDLVNKMYMDKSYEVLAKNSMKADSSWNAIAPKYLKLYQSI